MQPSPIPDHCGPILDIAPIDAARESHWLLLAADGRLFRLNATTNDVEPVGQMEIPVEDANDPFDGHTLRSHLHAAPDGRFAAVVNDYGRYGRILDLDTGEVTMHLDGGEYCCETVPFSFAFAAWENDVVAIHRTDWNRLDISDPSTGRLLAARDAGPGDGAKTSRHLDYFHGALYLNPSGATILDDGWIWYPVGVPLIWSFNHRLSGNIWESEDGASRRDVCARESFWDRDMAWLSDTTIAIAGIGSDVDEMVDGVRIFDISAAGKPTGSRWRDDWAWALEVTAFSGPAGRLFRDGRWLYSASDAGLFQWDPATGQQTGHIEGFHPTRHHHGAHELAELRGSVLWRWNTT